VPKYLPSDITGKVSVPAHLSVPIDDIKDLRVKKVHIRKPDSDSITTLGVTLNDG